MKPPDMSATWHSVRRLDAWWPEFERRVVKDTFKWLDPRGLLEHPYLHGWLLLTDEPLPQVVGHIAITVESDGYNRHVWGRQVRIDGHQPGAWKAGWRLVDDIARQFKAKYILSVTGRNGAAFARASQSEVMGTLIRRTVM